MSDVNSSSHLIIGLIFFCRYLDYFNIMAYDFHGSYNNFAGHNAPLRSKDKDNTVSKNLY